MGAVVKEESTRPYCSLSTNWLLADGSLDGSITFDTSTSIAAAEGTESIPVGFLLQRPSDSRPCEITIFFRERHEIHSIYVRSTARVYEIYYASDGKVNSNDYLCTVRCGAALQEVTANVCEGALAECKLPNDVNAVLPRSDGNKTVEDGWVEVELPDSLIQDNRRFSLSNISEANIVSSKTQIHYEATAEISDACPCMSVTLRLLSHQIKTSIHVEEIYIYADPVEDTDPVPPVSNVGTSSLLSMLVPGIVQLSKSGNSQLQHGLSDVLGGSVHSSCLGMSDITKVEASSVMGKVELGLDQQHREVILEDPLMISRDKVTDTDQVLKPTIDVNNLAHGCVLNVLNKPAEKQHAQTKSADGQLRYTEEEKNFDQSQKTTSYDETSTAHTRLETILDDLVSRVGRIETFCSSFQENIIKPLTRIDTRLQRMEEQLDAITKWPQSSELRPCSAISTPEYSGHEDDSENKGCIPSVVVMESDCHEKEALVDKLVVSLPESQKGSGLLVKAPEFPYADDDDAESCNSGDDFVDLEPKEYPKNEKRLPIDSALASALSAFLTSASNKSSMHNQDPMDVPNEQQNSAGHILDSAAVALHSEATKNSLLECDLGHFADLAPKEYPKREKCLPIDSSLSSALSAFLTSEHDKSSVHNQDLIDVPNEQLSSCGHILDSVGVALHSEALNNSFLESDIGHFVDLAPEEYPKKEKCLPFDSALSSGLSAFLTSASDKSSVHNQDLIDVPNEQQNSSGHILGSTGVALHSGAASNWFPQSDLGHFVDLAPEEFPKIEKFLPIDSALSSVLSAFLKSTSDKSSVHNQDVMDVPIEQQNSAGHVLDSTGVALHLDAANYSFLECDIGHFVDLVPKEFPKKENCLPIDNALASAFSAILKSTSDKSSVHNQDPMDAPNEQQNSAGHILDSTGGALHSSASNNSFLVCDSGHFQAMDEDHDDLSHGRKSCDDLMYADNSKNEVDMFDSIEAERQGNCLLESLLADDDSSAEINMNKSKGMIIRAPEFPNEDDIIDCGESYDPHLIFYSGTHSHMLDAGSTPALALFLSSRSANATKCSLKPHDEPSKLPTAVNNFLLSTVQAHGGSDDVVTNSHERSAKTVADSSLLGFFLSQGVSEQKNLDTYHGMEVHGGETSSFMCHANIMENVNHVLKFHGLHCNGTSRESSITQNLLPFNGFHSDRSSILVQDEKSWVCDSMVQNSSIKKPMSDMLGRFEPADSCTTSSSDAIFLNSKLHLECFDSNSMAVGAFSAFGKESVQTADKIGCSESTAQCQSIGINQMDFLIEPNHVWSFIPGQDDFNSNVNFSADKNLRSWLPLEVLLGEKSNAMESSPDQVEVFLSSVPDQEDSASISKLYVDGEPRIGPPLEKEDDEVENNDYNTDYVETDQRRSSHPVQGLADNTLLDVEDKIVQSGFLE